LAYWLILLLEEVSNFDINIIFFGNGPRGLACLEKLLEQRKNISLIVGHSESSSLKSVAESNGIAYVSPKNVNKQKFEETLKAFNPNLFILCGYNKILRDNILDIPKYKVINCHGGKLPEYRGTAPINWQLINGENVVGFTILYADHGIDTGEILKEIRFKIDSDIDAKGLLAKSLEWFPNELVSQVNTLETKGLLESIKQDETSAVYYTRRYPEDGYIDFSKMTALQVHNIVRALVRPYPGAFTFVNNQKVIIVKTSILESTFKGIPGVVAIKKENGCIIPCKDRSILIQQLEIDEKFIDATDYFKIGDRCK
jgi:methionyl-tRNA formyltransferase